jgi:hypothetical protein
VIHPAVDRVSTQRQRPIATGVNQWVEQAVLAVWAVPVGTSAVQGRKVSPSCIKKKKKRSAIAGGLISKTSSWHVMVSSA